VTDLLRDPAAPDVLHVGDVPTLTLSFVDAAGDPAPVDLADVTVRVKTESPRVSYPVDPSDLSAGPGVGQVVFRWRCTVGNTHWVHGEAYNVATEEGAGADGFFEVQPDPTA
jgi:hypothetical protein